MYSVKHTEFYVLGPVNRSSVRLTGGEEIIDEGAIQILKTT
jgi:hypothetical protein